MISFSSKIPSNLMSDALDCRDTTLGHMTSLAGSVLRGARRSPYQSRFDSFGKFFVQRINVVSLGGEL